MRIAERDDERLEHLRLLAETAGMELPELALPVDGNVIANGIRQHYVDWGGQGRPAVLFLHGGSLTAHTWDLTCLGLRSEFRCIAPDLRGHGDSEWPADGDYRLERYAEDVEALAEALGLERFVVVGHSLGGVTAIEYAGGGDDRLLGLVLVDVGPVVHTQAGERVRALGDATAGLETFDEYVARLRALNPRRDERLVRRGLEHNLRRLPSGRWAWKWDGRRVQAHSLSDLKERFAQLWERVDDIACPTLVVRGGRSEVLPRPDAYELAARLRDGRVVEVADAGHTVQGSNPAGLLEVLRPFLREVTHEA
jgi:pimeloyl-ACP methyl ester carboxylesterase